MKEYRVLLVLLSNIRNSKIKKSQQFNLIKIKSQLFKYVTLLHFNVTFSFILVLSYLFFFVNLQFYIPGRLSEFLTEIKTDILV